MWHSNDFTSASPSGPVDRAVRNPGDIDTMLAKELYDMSVFDRTNIQEEIHGATSLAPNPSPQEIEWALHEMQIEVDKIHPQHKRGYEQASLIQSHYILCDCNFRIKFLRADLFDVKAAANRLTKHVDLLWDFFGMDGLLRPLRLDDLSRSEQDYLRLGGTQVLPSRDRAQRLVIYHQQSSARVSSTTEVKVHLYIQSVISDDVETQKHGYVCVVNVEKAFRDDYRDTDASTWTKVFQALPVRLSAIHLTLPDSPAFHLYRALLMFDIFDKQKRIRTKFYKGSKWTTESLYQLITYGVPVNEFPTTPTNSLKTKYHEQWIRARSIFDQETEAAMGRDGCTFTNFTGIFHPGVNDVLFSKGGNPRHHGNHEFRNLMDSYVDDYNRTSDRDERRLIRHEIIDHVKAEPRCGRFLEMQKGSMWWTVMTDNDAIDWKVSVALYDRGRALNARRNRQNSKSDTAQFSGLDGNKRRKLLGDDGCCNSGDV